MPQLIVSQWKNTKTRTTANLWKTTFLFTGWRQTTVMSWNFINLHHFSRRSYAHCTYNVQIWLFHSNYFVQHLQQSSVDQMKMKAYQCNLSAVWVLLSWKIWFNSVKISNPASTLGLDALIPVGQQLGACISAITVTSKGMQNCSDNLCLAQNIQWNCNNKCY
jgi:hypothetical protein